MGKTVDKESLGRDSLVLLVNLSGEGGGCSGDKECHRIPRFALTLPNPKESVTAENQVRLPRY